MSAMTPAEQNELIDYARRFGYSVGNRHPRFTEDVVSASLHGAAIAFVSPDFPADVEGRRKFMGAACWNMMRREMTWFTKKQPILFTDLGEMYEPVMADPHDYEAEVDWADEFECLAAKFMGMTQKVFLLAYGPFQMTQAEISAEVGRSVPTIQYHMQKITKTAREQYERMEESA